MAQLEAAPAGARGTLDPRSIRRASSARATLRCSLIPIEDPSLIRGTTTAVLLEGFGGRLRGSIGGLGTVAASGDEEYAKSFVVPELGIFLSHSWHAKWWRKYLMLLLQFNMGPAVLASATVALLCCAVRARQPAMVENGTSCFEVPNPWWFQTLIVLGGGCTFLVVLFSWHFVSSAVPFLRTSIFLDKVCIHQSNPKRKEQGIKSIGGILDQSKSMLVAWDPTYFTRLWCIYELSAFKFARSDSNIIIRPMSLSNFVAGQCLICNATYMAWYAMDHASALRVVLALLALAMLPLAPCAMDLRGFNRERLSLKAQLANFQVRETKCFCCTNDHVHPETGGTLMCDRKHVFDSIANWYGRGDQEVGLDKFDERIRGEFKEDLHRTLGKSCMIPYSYSLLVGLAPALLHLAWSNRCPLRYSAPVFLEILLLRFPLCVTFTVYLCHLTQFEGRSAMQDAVVNLVVVAATAVVVMLSTATAAALQDATWRGDRLGARWAYPSWLASEFVLVLLFYFALARMHFHRARRATWHRTIELVTRGR